MLMQPPWAKLSTPLNRNLFFLITLAMLAFATPTNAQNGEPPIPNPPPSNSYVLDTLDWLSESQEQGINTVTRQLDSEGIAQIYVATLDNCGSDKTHYRRDIFNAWKIGSQKSNGGLLILVCWYGGDESRRSIEVKTDEKMQNVISDALTAKTAEDHFIPAFKEGRPGMGLVKMVIVFNSIIRDEKSATTPSTTARRMGIEPLLITTMLALILSSMTIRAWKNRSSGNKGRYTNSDEATEVDTRIWDMLSGDGGASDGGGSSGGGGGGSSTSF